jgi:hypothetical protein
MRSSSSFVDVVVIPSRPIDIEYDRGGDYDRPTARGHGRRGEGRDPSVVIESWSSS